MMSIGTLLAYSMVAGCVLLLRYEVDDPSTKGSSFSFGQFFNLEKRSAPTRFTSGLVTWSVTVYCVWCLGLSLVITQLEDNIDQW